MHLDNLRERLFRLQNSFEGAVIPGVWLITLPSASMEVQLIQMCSGILWAKKAA